MSAPLCSALALPKGWRRWRAYRALTAAERLQFVYATRGEAAFHVVPSAEAPSIRRKATVRKFRPTR